MTHRLPSHYTMSYNDSPVIIMCQIRTPLVILSLPFLSLYDWQWSKIRIERKHTTLFQTHVESLRRRKMANNKHVDFNATALDWEYYQDVDGTWYHNTLEETYHDIFIYCKGSHYDPIMIGSKYCQNYYRWVIKPFLIMTGE